MADKLCSALLLINLWGVYFSYGCMRASVKRKRKAFSYLALLKQPAQLAKIWQTAPRQISVFCFTMMCVYCFKTISINCIFAHNWTGRQDTCNTWPFRETSLAAFVLPFSCLVIFHFNSGATYCVYLLLTICSISFWLTQRTSRKGVVWSFAFHFDFAAKKMQNNSTDKNFLFPLHLTPCLTAQKLLAHKEFRTDNVFCQQ